MSRLKFDELIDRGILPDFPKWFAAFTKVYPDPKGMDEIEVFSYTDNSTGDLHAGFKFKYMGTFSVSSNFILNPHSPTECIAIHNVRVTNLISGELQHWDAKDGLIVGKDFFGESNVSEDPQPFAAKSRLASRAARVARQAGYRNPVSSQPGFPLGGRQRRLSHNVFYDHGEGAIKCSCFTDGQKWCRAISEHIDKSVDIPVVEDAVQSLRNTLSRDSTKLSVPVMPRTMLHLTITKHKFDGDEPGTYNEEFLLSAGDDLRVWWEPNMSLRPLVAEAFTLVRASDEYTKWVGLVDVSAAAHRLTGQNRLQRLKCNNKWHGNSHDKLFYTMLHERLDPNDSHETMVKNLAYLATLYAFYDVFEKRCYSCYVQFNPSNDVPEI